MDNFEHSSIMGCPKQGNFSAYVPLSQFGSFPEVKNVYQTDCKILKFLNIQLDVCNPFRIPHSCQGKWKTLL